MSFKMKTPTPILLSVLLGLVAAVPAPEPSPHCNDDCLLKLIRYREEANVDWLMALPYCSWILDSPVAARIQLQRMTLPLPGAPAPSETANSLVSASSVNVDRSSSSSDEITTSTTTITSTATTSTTTTVDFLQRRLDSDDLHVRNRCESYRALDRPQPSAWNGHSDTEIRKACVRILPWHRSAAAVPVEPAQAETVFVRPVALSLSSVVVAGSTQVVTLTIYTTITANVAPWPVESLS